jgi:hypothetical protein
VNDFTEELNKLANVVGKAKTPDAAALKDILKILANKTTEQLFQILESIEMK